MKAKAFIIHLARSTARKAQVTRIKAACPLDAEVIAAVDGQALSAAERAAVYVPSLHRPRYPFRLNKGEIGCFLSHRLAWKTIIARDLDAGLIIEDDVEITPETFANALDLALAHISKHGLIQFQVRTIKNPGATIARSESAALMRPDIAPLRMSCSLYSRAAAMRLLEFTRSFDRPIDSSLQLTWENGISPLIAVPSGVAEVSGQLGGTTIQRQDMPLALRLRHEVLRPLYRWQIKHRALKVLPDG